MSASKAALKKEIWELDYSDSGSADTLTLLSLNHITPLKEPKAPLEEFTLEKRRKKNRELETAIEFVHRVYGDHMRALVFTAGTLKRIDKPLYDRVYAEATKKKLPISAVMLSTRERLIKEIYNFDHSGKCYGDLSYREANRLKTAKYRLKKKHHKNKPNFLENF